MLCKLEFSLGLLFNFNLIMIGIKGIEFQFRKEVINFLKSHTLIELSQLENKIQKMK